MRIFNYRCCSSFYHTYSDETIFIHTDLFSSMRSLKKAIRAFIMIIMLKLEKRNRYLIMLGNFWSGRNVVPNVEEVQRYQIIFYITSNYYNSNLILQVLVVINHFTIFRNQNLLVWKKKAGKCPTIFVPTFHIRRQKPKYATNNLAHRSKSLSFELFSKN